MRTGVLARKCRARPVNVRLCRFPRENCPDTTTFQGKSPEERSKTCQNAPNGGASTVSDTQHYHFFPSTGVRVSAERSTPSKQRTLRATISLPLGAIPCENEPTPHRPQNRW